MDKNKDFIRLDDVFKSLEQGEETYRSGAWNDMKALLDKEMSVGSISGRISKLRYFLLPLLALLLAGGSYYFLTNSKKDLLQPASTDMALNNEPTKVSTPAVPKTETTSKSGLKENLSLNKRDGVDPKKNLEGETTKATAFVSSKKTHRTDLMTTTKQGTIAQNNPNRDKKILKEEIKRISSDGNKNKPVQALSVANNSNTEKRNSYLDQSVSAKIEPLNLYNFSISKPTLPVLTFSRNIPTNIIELQESLPILQKETVIAQKTPGSTSLAPVGKVINQTANQLAAENNLHPIKRLGALNEPPVYQSSNGGFYKEQKDTFKQVDLNPLKIKKTHLANRHLKPAFDTVSVQNIASVKFIPLSYAEMKAFHLLPDLNQVPIIPGYALSSNSAKTASNGELNTEEKTDLVPLQNYMVSSHRINNTHSGFSMLFANINNSLAGLMEGNKNWYISLMVGGNVGLGSPNAYGMQIGASFLYSIAERWTLSLGVNYHNTYFPNFSFWDAAVNYALQESSQPNGTLFSGTKYNEQTTVNANNLSRFDFPLLFSYNLGRVSLFGGSCFSYFLPLENHLATTVQATAVSQLVYNNKNPFESQTPNLNPSEDFRSRFGIGYAFGLSYDFSRKLSADVRLNQTLWDNTGRYQMDALKSIYRQPTVELNLSFFLGRREKVIYMMDRSRQ